MSVSYTHLDVYKRQIYEYPLILTHDIQSSMMDTIGIYGILICIPVALVGIIVIIKRKKDKHD